MLIFAYMQLLILILELKCVNLSSNTFIYLRHMLITLNQNINYASIHLF